MKLPQQPHGRAGTAFWCTLLLAFVAIVGVGACGHPCRELSDRVCRCAQNADQEARCLRQVRALASQDKLGHDAEATRQCVAFLQTCTCEALAAGDLAACGLAKQER